MSVELKVPSVGESITEVQIAKWLVKEGERVERDQVLVVIETDKVTVELPAPAAGVLTKISVANGSKANVGQVIGALEAGAAVTKAASVASAVLVKPEAAAPAAPGVAAQGDKVMPAARRQLAQAGLRASEVTASGPGGRLLVEDVQRHLSAGPATSPESVGSAPTPAPLAGSRQEEVVPLTPLRKRIAQRLVEAQSVAALLTTFNEIDMSAAMALRTEKNELFQKLHGVKLGFMSFFVRAAVDALQRVPQINAELRADNVVYRHYCDIGVAVGGGKGLVVPVLRNAERLGFAQIEQRIAELAKRAQENKLTLEELSGGTFTISNGGIYGSLLSTPIVNPPQSGILGLHAIQDRPVARNGQVVIRPMMYVALTYDHRLVDGREAVTFLKRIKECVEEPARMLLEI